MDTRVMHVKHPSTPYLDICPTANDKVLTTQSFIGEHVTITEKMDGEITSIYPDGSFHARSLDSGSSWHRDIIHSYLPNIRPAIRYDEHFVFENMYGVHSIKYDDLESYLYLLYIVRNGVVISYKQTQRIAVKAKLTMPKVLFSGVFRSANDILKEKQFREGFVMRLSMPFMYANLGRCTGKYVVPGFIQSDVHWTKSEPEINQLRRPT